MSMDLKLGSLPEPEGLRPSPNRPTWEREDGSGGTPLNPRG